MPSHLLILFLVISGHRSLARIIEYETIIDGDKRTGNVDVDMQPLTRVTRGVEAATWPKLQTSKTMIGARFIERNEDAMSNAETEISDFWRNFGSHSGSPEAHVEEEAVEAETDTDTMHILINEDKQEELEGNDADTFGEPEPYNAVEIFSDNVVERDFQLPVHETDKNMKLSSPDTDEKDDISTGTEEQLPEIEWRNLDNDHPSRNSYSNNAADESSASTATASTPPRRNQPNIIGYQTYPNSPYKFPVYMSPSGQIYTVNPMTVGNPYGVKQPLVTGRSNNPYQPNYVLVSPNQSYRNNYPYSHAVPSGNKGQSVPPPQSGPAISYPYQAVYG